MTIKENDELNKNLYYFIENQDILCSQYIGKYLLIYHQKVDSVYNTLKDAYMDAISKYTPGEFTLQHCIPGPEAYTIKLRPRYIR